MEVKKRGSGKIQEMWYSVKPSTKVNKQTKNHLIWKARENILQNTRGQIC